VPAFFCFEMDSAVVLKLVVSGEQSFMHQISPKERAKMVQKMSLLHQNSADSSIPLSNVKK
jgi:hypothetical protein